MGFDAICVARGTEQVEPAIVASFFMRDEEEVFSAPSRRREKP
jgi:hypothetical protein